MRIAYSGHVQEPHSGIDSWPTDSWDDSIADREARLGYQAPRPEMVQARRRRDRVVMAILGLCAFALLAGGS